MGAIVVPNVLLPMARFQFPYVNHFLRILVGISMVFADTYNIPDSRAKCVDVARHCWDLRRFTAVHVEYLTVLLHSARGVLPWVL